MRSWNLRPVDVPTLTLAADARLSTPDYTNDQIWELTLGSGDPAAVGLHTTYGLRARAMRIFPRFIEDDKVISDPSEFETPPSVHTFYPNYIELTFSPFLAIEVRAEYWIPESQIVAGRLRLFNSGITPRRFTLELVASLNPSTGGKPMTPRKVEAVTVLQGQTDELIPVVFLTGGPESSSSPYSSLIHKIELMPGRFRQLTWVQAATHDEEHSFQIARKVATRRWDSERARVKLTNSSQVEIYTGDEDWDIAFALSQKIALNLIHGPTDHLPYSSFVFSRLPDHGFSPRGDGSDYTHLWNGQPALETWYLVNLILPIAPEIAKNLVRNFIATQTEDGRIDGKPGLGGQRNNMLAVPILSSLVWRIYQHTEDQVFLEQTFSQLFDFLCTWFSHEQDRDDDGIPEWDNLIQSGYDDNPTFARWHAWAQGANVNYAESPALCAFLFRECQSLIKIAKTLKHTRFTKKLQTWAETLHTAVEDSWDYRADTYRYWDRDTHHTQRGEQLGERQGDGDIYIDKTFSHPTRTMLRIETESDSTISAHAFFHGSTPGGLNRVERIDRQQMRWFFGLGTATSENLYSHLERIQVQGIFPDDKVTVHSVNYMTHDHSLLLPLWAGIPNDKRAERLITRTISNPKRYGRAYGMPACPRPPKSEGTAICNQVWLPWNVLIAEGLLVFGARGEAADLVTRLMTGIIQSLKKEGSFSRHYLADTGECLGERNTLVGLPPVGLFLDTLGVRLISSWRVALSGFNPYPWPVTIKYRGLTIHCLHDKTSITFPDEQTFVLDEPTECIVDGMTHFDEQPIES
jgi:hypothetical protein